MLGRARTKERCTKDSDSNPSVVNRDVLEDTAIGAGELATKQRSVGLNKSTQRAVHHKTHCKETYVNGQTQRRKGKVTTNFKEKGKGKIQEKGTTTRTRLDLRMRKLDKSGWTILV